MLRLFISLFAFALITQTPMVYAKISSEADAANSLMHRVNKSQIYAPWLKIECTSVYTETKTSKFYEFSLHEKHGGNCEGDPNISPLIDRFRVSRVNNTILWYDIGNDKYLPFNALIKYRKSKNE